MFIFKTRLCINQFLFKMKYFTIKELSKSTTADQYKIDNTPTQEAAKNLILLVDNILDPLREALGKSITVTSGYRSKALNSKVKGSTTSQHVLGQAADIKIGGPSENKKLFELIQKLNLPYDQLIDEYNFSWVHVSYGPRNRKQILHIK